ncbi:type II toxin-antitoxin system VapB family antitoxin [Oceanibaculum nanhaiense]|jgi:antitoxin VapB|uniref:type II toxin-antitoxin system VapB family antitoxin n=1 Tax=Oceanibaculum nanhaiense TaxID=1909734 RepID=UPI000A378113|nr:type II toxin-antitoxin system VapB family antitoxin [Oceanibaculum nanhaiense]MBC7136110.1 type II toxin-antitoxin system VapB family antitoxin [Oceanibaculum nanhaiense]MDM7945393.1 type II toxin-antitoxin system VapB family antitoxin [Oceanibaculum nanhaiense]
MALSIKDQETDRLAREVARRTGTSLTEAVTQALREKLLRLKARQVSPALTEELDEIARRCGSLPVRDGRSAEEIVGYDEAGLPR